MRDSGGNVSLAPQIEVQMGHGWAPAQKAESAWHPRRVSAPTWPPRHPPTSSRRCTRSSRRERGRRHQATWDEDLDGNTPTPDLITVSPGPALGHARRRQGGRHRRPRRLDHAGQEGRPGHHRRQRRQRRAHHRPGRGGRAAPRTSPTSRPSSSTASSASAMASSWPTCPGRASKVLASRDYLVSQVGHQEGWLPTTA